MDVLVDRNREHVGHVPVFQRRAQPVLLAVGLVAGDPRRGHAGVEGAGEYPGRELGLGGELHVAGNTRLGAPLAVHSPALQQVQLPIGEGALSG